MAQTNIRQMSVADAQDALKALGSRTFAGSTPQPQDIQTILDATDHPVETIIEQALQVISSIKDKTPFISALVKHATDHSRPEKAKKAFFAMAHATDITPFYPAIKGGVSATNPAITMAALAPLASEAVSARALPVHLQQALSDATDHYDNGVVNFSMAIISFLQNVMPYVSLLTRHANDHSRPSRAHEAIKILNGAGISPFAQPATAPAPLSPCPPPPVKRDASPAPAAVTFKDIRLDFNIEANGGGPDVHRNDANRALRVLFDNAVTGSNIRTKAKVFYSPDNRLQENDIIELVFPASRKDAVLSATLQGVAPEFDLTQGPDGTYAGTMKDSPRF